MPILNETFTKGCVMGNKLIQKKAKLLEDHTTSVPGVPESSQRSMGEDCVNHANWSRDKTMEAKNKKTAKKGEKKDGNWSGCRQIR